MQSNIHSWFFFYHFLSFFCVCVCLIMRMRIIAREGQQGQWTEKHGLAGSALRPLLLEIYSAPPNTKTPSVRLCPGFIANPNELMPETGTDQKFWNRKHLHPSSHQAHTCPPSIKKKIFSQTFAERNHPWKKRFVTRIGFAICMGKWQLLGSRADLATSSIQGRAGWRRYR